jgi:hypothetical protein
MSIFKRVLKNIEENKLIKDQGGFNAIPWLRLPKFSSVMPGVMRRTYYLITASSKVGKTQLTDFMFVLEPYNFINSPVNKGSNIEIDIDYFLLEMSEEEKITTFLSHFLYVDHGIRIEPNKLLSLYQQKTVSDELFQLTRSKAYADKFEDFESKIKIHDNIANPYGIYKECYNYAKQNGYYVDSNGQRIAWEDLSLGSKSEAYKFVDHYVPNNPNVYKIIIVDHTSLLTPEKGGTLHAAMDNWSSIRALDLKKKFGYTIVDVQQQAAEVEKQQFNYKGHSITEKLKPGPDGLADNKKTQRNIDVMFGLFGPARYNIGSYPEEGPSYEINRMGDSYRELSILLNRKGGGLQSVDLYFDGATNYFKELPEVTKMTPETYKNIMKRNVKVT